MKLMSPVLRKYLMPILFLIFIVFGEKGYQFVVLIGAIYYGVKFYGYKAVRRIIRKWKEIKKKYGNDSGKSRLAPPPIPYIRYRPTVQERDSDTARRQ